MRKKLLVAIFISFSFLSALHAQEKGTSDISANIGFGTSTEISNLFVDVLTGGFTGGQISTSEIKAGPTFGLTYRYAVVNRWMVHADVFYQKMTSDVYVSGVKNGELDYSYVTVGIGTDYRYISRNIFQMYSGVAVAYTSENVKSSGSYNSPDTNGFVNYQFNVLGFRVGKKFAGFAELGYGYKGIINAGVSYQF